ncbi:MAG TPA: hypothetical protein PL169_28380, partial [Leptospiraceae bacterium]|nr:hypothetical protein [Leptospiraceae bacterium]
TSLCKAILSFPKPMNWNIETRVYTMKILLFSKVTDVSVFFFPVQIQQISYCLIRFSMTAPSEAAVFRIEAAGQQVQAVLCKFFDNLFFSEQ